MQRGIHAAVFTAIIPLISVTIAIASGPSVEQLAPQPLFTIQTIANRKHLSVGEACWGRKGMLSLEQISVLKYAEVANSAFPYKSMCGLERRFPRSLSTSHFASVIIKKANVFCISYDRNVSRLSRISAASAVRELGHCNF